MNYSTRVLSAMTPDLNSDPPIDLSWLGPTITACGVVLVAAIGVASVLIGKRQDRKNAAAAAVENAEIAIQPKVTDGWDEVRKARAEATTYYNLYRVFEDLFYRAFSALRHLARSVHDVHPEQKFDQDVVDALAIVPPDTTEAVK